MNSTRRIHLPLVVAVAAFAAAAQLFSVTLSPAAAAQAWYLRTRADFGDARLESVALSPEGWFTLSPAVDRLAEAPAPFLWCAAIGPDGAAYVGGGNSGQVFKVGKAGMDVVFDAPEVEIHAIAFDAQGRLYAASSPHGRVYRVAAGREPETFFQPDSTYIWALAFDGAGNLIVATGQPARIFRVTPAGKSETLLEGREEHIRALAADGHGGFYAGSDQGGVVYRVPQEGAVSVLYDTPAREISALAVVDGDVYAAALAAGPRGRSGPEPGRGPVTRVRVTAEGGGDTPDDAEPPPETAQPQPQRGQPAESYTGAIFRISAAGYGRKIWESRENVPLSLVPLPGGRLLVGTGDKGKLISLTPTGDASELATLEASQINAFAVGRDGAVFAATSNLGALFQVSRGYSKTGTITSAVRDAGFVSRWGALSWTADTPSGTELALDVRTGDTEDPDSTWSPWSKPYGDPRAALIDRPDARYLQWRATLKSTGDATALLKAVEVHYLPRNMPPEFESLDVLPPGVWLQSNGQVPPVGDDASDAPRRPTPPKRGFQRGMRSAAWKATDANGDPLRAEVQFRAEDETTWKTLESSVDEDFVSWDSTAMPDGVYRLRVVTSDAAANPAGRGFTAQRDSGPFDVDNTPPVVDNVRARVTGKIAEITATVTDTFSVVGETTSSADAGDWVPILPEDGIPDSRRETYRFTTKDLAPGEHSVVIRSKDRAGNVSSGKVVFRVP